MAEVIVRKVDEADLIRALGEVQRLDPEVVRALASVRIEEIRAGEGIASFFVQLFAMISNELKVDSKCIRHESRLRRLEKAYELSAKATLALYTARDSLRGSKEFAALLIALEGGKIQGIPPLAALLGPVRRP